MSSRKKIRFIVPYPPGQAPSQRFRFEQYLPWLKEQGFDITVSPFLDDQTWKTLYKPGHFFAKAWGITKSFFRRFGLLFSLQKDESVFIHREAAPMGPPVFEWMLAKVLRKPYIYDFDDAIWLPNYSESNARFQRLKAYGKVRKIAKWAGHVTAGNDYLANFARTYNSNVTIIPTTIDTDHLHRPSEKPKTELIIGWTGTHSTMHYLDELIPVLKELETRYVFTFLVISDQAPGYDLRSLRFVPWNKTTEIADLQRISIGVMPLKADQWSEGKCGFKGLQYMALEIPTILSPVGVNTTIITDGENGMIASTPEEWAQKLSLLLEDEFLRESLGKAGRRTVIERYSVVAMKHRYLEILGGTSGV